MSDSGSNADIASLQPAFSLWSIYRCTDSRPGVSFAGSREKTREYIGNESGKHFDPHIVDVFLKRMVGAT